MGLGGGTYILDDAETPWGGDGGGLSVRLGLGMEFLDLGRTMWGGVGNAPSVHQSGEGRLISHPEYFLESFGVIWGLVGLSWKYKGTDPTIGFATWIVPIRLQPAPRQLRFPPSTQCSRPSPPWVRTSRPCLIAHKRTDKEVVSMR